MFNVSFSDATEADLPQIKDLIDSVKGDSNNLKAEEFIVAHDGGKIIGCVRTINVDLNFHRMESLAVLSEYRGQGIGGELVKKIITKDKIRPIYLICFAEREKFYNINNFQKINPDDLPEVLQKDYLRIKSNYTDPEIDIIAMKLE